MYLFMFKINSESVICPFLAVPEKKLQGFLGLQPLPWETLLYSVNQMHIGHHFFML
jgi:hypothetical protein